jgi:hypothetical protein
MAYADTLRSGTITAEDIADSIEGVMGASGVLGASSSWTPTFTGFSADPTNLACRYWKIGKMVILNVRMGSAGTSNSTAFTMTLPATAATITNMLWSNHIPYAVDNSGEVSTAWAYISSGGTTITLSKTAGGYPNWTSSGIKKADFTLIYEAA